ncbi:uncharacterized protein [Elaeis guineensis]|uniref:uncharacterized protein isoform X1 n=1 Tax=Elaeis guineensis var. tenera TaxID=51953 RepID=UPI003C6D4CF2
MARCLSFTAARDRCYDRNFSAAGLRPTATVLGDGATVHCWAPKSPDPGHSPLLLIHGFGANAKWQWAGYLRPLLRSGFDLYVPDLLFFGGSEAPRPDRSEAYQARCLAAAMEALGARRFGVVGNSYGGFVAYQMAAMFPEAVERVVLISAGVCLEERDLAAGLFVVSNVAEAASILLPQRPDKLRQLVRLSFCNPPRVLPTCCIWDYIQVMCTAHVTEKTELINALVKDRKLSDLPKITQPTLIIWGEQDRIFPLELAHRLERHLGENSQLIVIKNAGHAVNLEKSKEVCEHIKAFFLNFAPKGHKNHMCYGTRWKIIVRFAGLSIRRLAAKLPLLLQKKTEIFFFFHYCFIELQKCGREK